MPRFEGERIRRRDGDTRDPHSARWLMLADDLAKDLRFAVRSLGRSPGFTIAAGITIALGIGATTAILSIGNAVLLRPLPVVEPERLAAIWESRRGAVLGSLDRSMVPYERYEAFAEATPDVFTSLAALRYATLTLRAGEQAEAVQANLTSGNYFQVLGLRPAAGRFYAEDGEAAVVLSHAFWRSRFGGDSTVIGQTVYIDSRPFAVAGVAPAGFSGTTALRSAVDLWVPMVAYRRLTGPGGLFGNWVMPFGRLRPGMDRALAQAQVATVAQRIPPNERQTRVTGALLDPLAWRGDNFAETTRFLGMFLAAAVFVLLIASANVAGMLIARAVGRRREVAVRLAIGAGPGRLVRQLLAENMLLFVAGGLGGWILAIWATRLLPRLDYLFDEPPPLDLTPDFGVVAAALGLAASIGILFGLGPALRAARLDLASTLKEGLTVAGGRTGQRRRMFVVAQVALTAPLLMTAGLFVRSVWQGQNVDLGFDPAGVVVATTSLGPHGYDEARGRVFYDQLAERVRGIAGVESVALANIVLVGGNAFGNDVEAEDPGPAGPTRTNALWNVVDTAYFRTMQIELAAGRAFTVEDRAGGTPVVIVNETLAGRLWPGESAVGKRLREGSNVLEVIGVTRDGKYQSVTEEPKAFAFLPFAQEYDPGMTLHVRAPTGASGIPEHIAREVRELDANVAVQDARLLERAVDASLWQQRFAAVLTGLFGLIGIVLAAIGIYGVLSMHVAQRSREFAIRMTLGARRGDVLRSVIARGAVLASIGAVVGLVLASGLTRAVRSFLFGVSPLDPITFATVASLLISAALIASYLPANRATTADPLDVLRQE